MANLNGFNANNVKPSQSFDPLPAGKYLATITASEMLPTNNGNGQFLKLEFVVAEGEHKGRKLWSRLNLNNPSAQAVEIAQRQLSAICHAVGVLEPRDSVDLHNLPLMVKVKIGKNHSLACLRKSDPKICRDQRFAYTAFSASYWNYPHCFPPYLRTLGSLTFGSL